eukprot:TRINITY_DN45902_c0_g1_i1.p1 TRINITY_DN45902_c0_g1~~TRINITY_DN45902_c0_g1_i1.p1  ORF type:complete len:696 (-),score=89.21 TRINITY_DN45902_c0_g1_i1:69-2117(-)
MIEVSAAVSGPIKQLFEQCERDVLSTLYKIIEILNEEGADVGISVAPSLDAIHIVDLRSDKFKYQPRFEPEELTFAAFTPFRKTHALGHYEHGASPPTFHNAQLDVVDVEEEDDILLLEQADPDTAHGSYFLGGPPVEDHQPDPNTPTTTNSEYTTDDGQVTPQQQQQPYSRQSSQHTRTPPVTTPSMIATPPRTPPPQKVTAEMQTSFSQMSIGGTATPGSTVQGPMRMFPQPAPPPSAASFTPNATVGIQRDHKPAALHALSPPFYDHASSFDSMALASPTNTTPIASRHTTPHQSSSNSPTRGSATDPNKSRSTPSTHKQSSSDTQPSQEHLEVAIAQQESVQMLLNHMLKLQADVSQQQEKNKKDAQQAMLMKQLQQLNDLVVKNIPPPPMPATVPPTTVAAVHTHQPSLPSSPAKHISGPSLTMSNNGHQDFMSSSSHHSRATADHYHQGTQQQQQGGEVDHEALSTLLATYNGLVEAHQQASAQMHNHAPHAPPPSTTHHYQQPPNTSPSRSRTRSGYSGGEQGAGGFHQQQQEAVTQLQRGASDDSMGTERDERAATRNAWGARGKRHPSRSKTPNTARSSSAQIKNHKPSSRALKAKNQADLPVHTIEYGHHPGGRSQGAFTTTLPYFKQYGYYKKYGAAGCGAKTAATHNFPCGAPPAPTHVYTTGTSSTFSM